MTTKRALITGITGQDGSYLAELLLEKGYEVARHGPPVLDGDLRAHRPPPGPDHARARRPPRPGVDDRTCSTSTGRPRSTTWRPSRSCQTSFGQPVLTGEITGLGVTRMLDAIRIVDPEIRFYQASSSRDVRQGPGGAAERVDAVLPALAVRRRQGLRALDHDQLPRELRPARLVGHPLQPRVAPARARVRDPQDHPTPWPASSSVMQEELRLGNLDAQRDWGFAGDYVEAMWLMLQQDEPDDYVVATGETHSVREFCEIAFGHVGPGLGEVRRGRRAASSAPPRSTCSSAIRPRRTRSSAGRPKTTFEELVTGWWTPTWRCSPAGSTRSPLTARVRVGGR